MTEKLDADVNLIKAVERLNEELRPFIEEEQDRAESLTKSAKLEATDNAVSKVVEDLGQASPEEDVDGDNLGS